MKKIKLTKYSHGAGCGCKIAPDVLEKILKGKDKTKFCNLIVGNESKDDAAVIDLGNGTALISTTDFFMPIVDDPYDFGRVAATNSISDVYAMGGTPILAISILGWPIEKLSPDIARDVVRGAQDVCKSVDIPLAGGHSIDSPEPIFGLAVNGIVKKNHIKRNDGAKEGDLLFLTKPLGIGLLTSAQKHKLLRREDDGKAVEIMTTLNKAGESFGKLSCIHAMTDVTGFGLLGHLLEMAQGSNLKAKIFFEKIPVIKEIHHYLKKDCSPGGTFRNLRSYEHHVTGLDKTTRLILADPQTSGGLLVAVEPPNINEYIKTAKKLGLPDFSTHPFGKMVKGSGIEITRAGF